LAKKLSIRKEFLEVIYSEERWNQFAALRRKAAELMKVLVSSNFSPIIYGSIARGDVGKSSDIDVFIPQPVSSVAVEMALERADIKPRRRILVQATPSYALKACFEIEELVSVSIPLVKLTRTEREFYKFAGEIALEQIKLEKRVSGVDKRLMLIEPTRGGHIESSIIGRESYVSKLLGVSSQIVNERVRVLMKRDKVGRTGIFLERDLPSDETFESILREIARTSPALRRRLES
jgi:hypothetical protein